MLTNCIKIYACRINANCWMLIVIYTGSIGPSDPLAIHSKKLNFIGPTGNSQQEVEFGSSVGDAAGLNMF